MSAPLRPGPRLFVSSGCCWDLPPEQIFAVADACGADGVELVLGPEFCGIDDATVRRAAAAYGRPVNLHAPFDLVADDARAPRLRERTLAIGRIVRPGMIVLHPPDDAIEAAAIVRRCRPVIDAIRTALPGADIGLENLGCSPPAAAWNRLGGADVSRVDALADAARGLGVCLVLDTAHLASWGLPVTAVHRRHADLIRLVHFSDHAGGREHLAPGTGDARLGDYAAYLATVQPIPDLTIELYPGHLPDRAPDAVAGALRRALAFVRRRLGA